MTTLLFIIQVFIVVMLVALILVQKTGTDSLAGLSGGGHNVFSSKGSSNFLTKLTAILATAFMINCLVIAKVSSSSSKDTKSIIDTITIEQPEIVPMESKEAPEVPSAQ
jgi:preprotein translocase subunit SecG